MLKPQKPPFDVGEHRLIPFSLAKPGDLREARQNLKRAVEEVLKEGFVVINPVTLARGRLEIEDHALPQMRLLLEQTDGLKASVSSMQFDIDQLRSILLGQVGAGPTPAYLKFSGGFGPSSLHETFGTTYSSGPIAPTSAVSSASTSISSTSDKTPPKR